MRKNLFLALIPLFFFVLTPLGLEAQSAKMLDCSVTVSDSEPTVLACDRSDLPRHIASMRRTSVIITPKAGTIYCGDVDVSHETGLRMTPSASWGGEWTTGVIHCIGAFEKGPVEVNLVETLGSGTVNAYPFSPDGSFGSATITAFEPAEVSSIPVAQGETICVPYCEDRKQTRLVKESDDILCYRWTLAPGCGCNPWITLDGCSLIDDGAAAQTGVSPATWLGDFFLVDATADFDPVGVDWFVFDNAHRAYSVLETKDHILYGDIMYGDNVVPEPGNYLLTESGLTPSWEPESVFEDPAAAYFYDLSADWEPTLWVNDYLFDADGGDWEILGNTERRLELVSGIGSPPEGSYFIAEQLVAPWQPAAGEKDDGWVENPALDCGVTPLPEENVYVWDFDATPPARYLVTECVGNRISFAEDITVTDNASVIQVGYEGTSTAVHGNRFTVSSAEQLGFCPDPASPPVELENLFYIDLETGNREPITGCEPGILTVEGTAVVNGPVYTFYIISEGVTQATAPGVIVSAASDFTPGAFDTMVYFNGPESYPIVGNTETTLTLNTLNTPEEGPFEVYTTDWVLNCDEMSILETASPAIYSTPEREAYIVAHSAGAGHIKVTCGEGLGKSEPAVDLSDVTISALMDSNIGYDHSTGTYAPIDRITIGTTDPPVSALAVMGVYLDALGEAASPLVLVDDPAEEDPGLVVRNIPSGVQDTSDAAIDAKLPALDGEGRIPVTAHPTGTYTVSGGVMASQGTAAAITAPWPVRLSNATDWFTHYTSGTSVGTEAFSLSTSEAYQHPTDATETVRLRPSPSHITDSWALPALTTWTGSEYSAPDHVVTGDDVHESVSVSLALQAAEDSTLSRRLESRIGTPALTDSAIVSRGITYWLNNAGDAVVPFQQDTSGRLAVTAHPTGTYTVSGGVMASQGTAAAITAPWPVIPSDGTNAFSSSNPFPSQLYAVDTAGTGVFAPQVDGDNRLPITAHQGGTWSARTQDGAGNNLESTTDAPAGTERGLIVRNIPSGRQDVVIRDSAGNEINTGVSTPAVDTRGITVRLPLEQVVRSQIYDSAGNAIASAIAAPLDSDRGLVTRSLAYGRTVGDAQVQFLVDTDGRHEGYARIQDGAGTAITSRTDGGRQDLHVFDTAIDAKLPVLDGESRIPVTAHPTGTYTVTGTVAATQSGGWTIDTSETCVPNLYDNPTVLAACDAGGTITASLDAGRYTFNVTGEATYFRLGVAALATGGTLYVPGTQQVIQIAADATDIACRSPGAGGTIEVIPCL